MYKTEFIDLNKRYQNGLMQHKNNAKKEKNEFANEFGLTDEETEEYDLLYKMQVNSRDYEAALEALKRTNHEKFLLFLQKHDKERYNKEMLNFRKKRHSDYLRYTKENDVKAYHDEKNRMEVNKEIDFDDLPTWRYALMLLEDILCYW